MEPTQAQIPHVKYPAPSSGQLVEDFEGLGFGWLRVVGLGFRV